MVLMWKKLSYFVNALAIVFFVLHLNSTVIIKPTPELSCGRVPVANSTSDATNTNSKSNNTRNLIIDVYGGSITACHGVKPEHCYTEYLAQHLPGVTVRNKGIPASGVAHWLMCGMDPADIIVSEFRINERAPKTLQRWYRTTNDLAQHTVVLDLWSWLVPPSSGYSPTTQALQDTFPGELSRDSNFSVLSLEKRDLFDWKERVPRYFNRAIGAKCFENRYGTDAKSKEIMLECRQKKAGPMQHGGPEYHKHIGEALVEHIRNVVLHRVSAEGQATPAHNRTQLCYGQWGYTAAHHVLGWSDVVVEKKLFHINNPFTGMEGKITMNTNNTAATLILSCPPLYTKMSLGYIAHSEQEEAGIFYLNNDRNVSTFLKGSPQRGIRIRKYTEPINSTLPVHVSIQQEPLLAGVHIEFTDVSCSR